MLIGNPDRKNMENIFVDFVSINMFDKFPILTILNSKETCAYKINSNAPVHAANLVANSGNTAYGVDSINSSISHELQCRISVVFQWWELR